jgi:hypothetical protein
MPVGPISICGDVVATVVERIGSDCRDVDVTLDGAMRILDGPDHNGPQVVRIHEMTTIVSAMKKTGLKPKDFSTG